MAQLRKHVLTLPQKEVGREQCRDVKGKPPSARGEKERSFKVCVCVVVEIQ
jgi:hypothetical protein